VKKIAVIGAGIVGICSAYFLQKSGFKVTLVDHNEPGSMTSSGHACTFADYACVPVNSPTIFKDFPAMVLRQDGPLAMNFAYMIKNLPWAISFLKNCSRDKVEYIASSLAGFLKHSRLSYDQLFKEIDVSQYINNNETLYLYKTEKEYQAARYSIDLRKRNGVNIRELNAAEINDLEPNIAPVYYCGLIFEGSRHTTSPVKVSKKIFESFLHKGGSFLNKKITTIDNTPNGITIISESNTFDFDNIIISAGAWSNELALMIGDRFPLDTERGYHVLFDNQQKVISRPVGWSQSGFYLIQIEEGIRAAGTVEIAGLQKDPNPKRLKMIEREARKVIPTLGKVKSTWLGFRPTLPDSLPVIGQSGKDKNVFYAFGHQHIGWTLGAVTGKVMVELVNDRKSNFDLSPFDPKRFN
jgi:D-amino-acid dehydrogenase